MAAAVRLPGVDGAAATGTASDDAADGAELHGSRRTFARRGAGGLAPRLTLVTLDCTLFDITKSVAEAVAGVHSPVVLRLWCYASGANRWMLRSGGCLQRPRRGTRASDANAERGPPVRSSPEPTPTASG